MRRKRIASQTYAASPGRVTEYQALSATKTSTAEVVESLSAEDVTVDHLDRDIDDRDVLRGLKFAISAACNEDFDAWVRRKTGLRVRRLLADFKTFETLEEEERCNAQGQTARLRRAEKRRGEKLADMARRSATARSMSKKT
jgi:hypothetical protein